MPILYSALVYPHTPADWPYRRPPTPESFVRFGYAKPGWSPYSADPADRTEYWEDTNGTLTEAEVLLLVYPPDGIPPAPVNPHP